MAVFDPGAVQERWMFQADVLGRRAAFEAIDAASDVLRQLNEQLTADTVDFERVVGLAVDLEIASNRVGWAACDLGAIEEEEER